MPDSGLVEGGVSYKDTPLAFMELPNGVLNEDGRVLYLCCPIW